MGPLLLDVRQVFNKAQDGIVVSKLCDSMYSYEENNTEEEFWESFLDHLRKAMIYYKAEPAVEKVMEFCAVYATFHKRSKTQNKSFDENSGDTSVSEPTDPFLVKIFEFLLQNHNSRDKAVRYRCCQLINKILGHLGDEDTIDEDISDAIYECMMIRLKDKFPLIRIQAVLALVRLQDPEDDDCPVINAFLHSLETDTNSDVRKAVLSSVALSRKTLPYILGRIRDVKDVNRKTTFLTLSEKVSIRALTIAQRINVLTNGLKDRSESVKHACGQMLAAWLRFYEHNAIKLLEALDIEGSLDCSKLVLETLFKDAPIEKMESHVKALVDIAETSNEEGPIKMVSHQLLTPENVYYWHMVCKHLKELGEEGELLLQKVLPELTNFCEYVQSYAEKYFIDSAILTAFEGKEGQPEFILEQLLNIAGLLDFSDEVGRKNLKNLVHDLLVCETVPLSLVNILVSRYSEVEKAEDKFVQDLVETIADIRQPLVAVMTTAAKENNRRHELQIARLTMSLNECKEDLDEAIKQQNYQQAAILKDEIAELQSQREALSLEVGADKEDAHQRVEKDDPETVLKCLLIASSMLSRLKKKGLTPTIMALKEQLMFEGVKNEDPFIRNEAVLCLGHLSLMSKDFATQHLILFLQVAQVDQELLQITAVKIIFDLFMMFGLQAFDVEPDKTVSEQVDETKEDEEEGEKTVIEETPPEEQTVNNDETTTNTAVNNAAESVLGILILFLESESPDLRTTVVEGLAKLLVSGRVLSAKILSRLIILWYNPITEDDIKLRHCLGVFLPVFSFENRSNLELVEECFLPVVKKIVNAPTTSPLSQVNVANVIHLLIQLTDVRRLAHYQNISNPQSAAPLDTHVHDSLAIKICNEILSDPDDLDIAKIYCKALTQLHVCANNIIAIQDLQELSSQLMEQLKSSRMVKKMIEKFIQQLENLTNSRVTSLTSSQTESDQGLNSTTVTADKDTTLTKDTTLKNESNVVEEQVKAADDVEDDADADDTLTDIGAKALQMQVNDSLSRDVKHKLSLSSENIRSSSKKPRLSLSRQSVDIDFAIQQQEEEDNEIEDSDEE